MALELSLASPRLDDASHDLTKSAFGGGCVVHLPHDWTPSQVPPKISSILRKAFAEPQISWKWDDLDASATRVNSV